MVTDAFAILKQGVRMCSKSLEWSTPLWCASVDLTNAFDRIEYTSLFEAQRLQNVPRQYLRLFASMYCEQMGSVSR